VEFELATRIRKAGISDKFRFGLTKLGYLCRVTTMERAFFLPFVGGGLDGGQYGELTSSSKGRRRNDYAQCLYAENRRCGQWLSTSE
jgi:hypothetical protein